MDERGTTIYCRRQITGGGLIEGLDSRAIRAAIAAEDDTEDFLKLDESFLVCAVASNAFYAKKVDFVHDGYAGEGFHLGCIDEKQVEVHLYIWIKRPQPGWPSQQRTAEPLREL